MNDMTPAVALRMIPVAELTLSPLNTRKLVTDEEVAAMAESIATSGLLQNLIGLGRDGHVEIVGGGKRLRALQALLQEAETGWMRNVGSNRVALGAVPVLVTDDPEKAIAWSGVENAARSELHPADEIEAYAAMQAQHFPISMIAATFAVSERRVMRLLRLAILPDRARQALRDGRISIDQARALTIARDEKACLAVLDSVLEGRIHPNMIRHTLSQQQIRGNDRRAVYVGLEAYAAAGGGTTLDLFEDQSYLHDEALLNRLFVKKAEAEAERVRTDEGWAWATFVRDVHLDYDHKEVEHIEPVPGDLPEGDIEEYYELAEIGKDALTDEGRARLEELQARLDGDFTDEQRSIGGIYCRVDSQGCFKVHRAFVRKADLHAAEAEGEDGEATTATRPAAPEPEKIPQNLRDDMAAIALRAVQVKLFDRFEMALDLLGFSLTQTFGYDRPLQVSVEPQPATPEKQDGLIEDARFARPEGMEMRGTANALAAFRAKGKSHRNKVITLALARAMRRSPPDLFQTIATEVQPDIRAIWTPTASNYLGRVPVAQLDRLWSELVGDLSELAFAPLKKAEKAKHLERLFNDLSYREALGLSRAQNAVIDAWLPEDMRILPADPAEETTPPAAEALS